MKYKLIYPVGFLPPIIWDTSFEESSYTKKETLPSEEKILLSKEETSSYSDFSIRCLAISNFLLRLILYPFNFLANLIITMSIVVSSIVFNIIWCLGGCMSDSFSGLTKKLNQIAITRCGWLMFDPFFFIWDQLKLFAGIFIPQYALETMKQLHEFAHDLTDDIIHHLDLQALHFKRLRKIQKFLNEHEHYIFAAMVGSLLAEPVETILFALRYPKGMDNASLKEYGLNPVELTPEQLRYPPSLFLHGDSHNSSGCLLIAEYLQQKNYKGAVFTVNYPRHDSTAVILARMKEIQSYYPNSDAVKFNLIAHSKGCLMVYIIESTKLINKAVLIGMDHPAIDKIVDSFPDGLTIIGGKYDTFFPAPDLTKNRANPNRFFVDAGHLGTLSNPETLSICHQRLTG